MTIILNHETAAALLFASQQGPVDAVAAARVIARHYRLHPDIAEAVAEMAQAFGDHPDESAARMARCLALAPDRVEIPDAPLDCAGHGRHAPGALQLTDAGLLCRAHLADHALAETPGGDDDGQ